MRIKDKIFYLCVFACSYATAKDFSTSAGALCADEFRTLPILELSGIALSRGSRGVRASSSVPSAQKAEEVLGIKLNPAQKEAVEKAHRVGQGEIGRDGTPAGIGNYTQDQLRRKAEILKTAGFSQNQRRQLMEKGVVGDDILTSFFHRLTIPRPRRIIQYEEDGRRIVLYDYGRQGVLHLLKYPLSKKDVQSMVKGNIKYLTYQQLRTLKVEYLRDKQLVSFDDPNVLRRVPVKQRNALEDRILQMTERQRERFKLNGLKKRLESARENGGDPYLKGEARVADFNYYGE